MKLAGRSIADTVCSSKPLRGPPDLWVLIGGVLGEGWK
jgi:hypothetical protein